MSSRKNDRVFGNMTLAVCFFLKNIPDATFTLDGPCGQTSRSLFSNTAGLGLATSWINLASCSALCQTFWVLAEVLLFS
jgi:hypothetical protein